MRHHLGSKRRTGTIDAKRQVIQRPVHVGFSTDQLLAAMTDEEAATFAASVGNFSTDSKSTFRAPEQRRARKSPDKTEDDR